MKTTILSAFIALAFSIQGVVIAKNIELNTFKKDTSTLSSHKNRSLVDELPARNLLDYLGYDNVAQIVLHTDKADIDAIAAKFTHISLSQGAYLEIINADRSQTFRYDAKEIQAVTDIPENKNIFSPLVINGKNMVLRLVYPKSAKPAASDKAIFIEEHFKIPSYSDSPSNSGYWKQDLRKPVACIKETHPEIWSRQNAIAYLTGTGWLIGGDNYLLTNHHVLGEKYPVGAISHRPIYLNYQAENCDQPTQATDNLVPLKGGTIVKSGLEYGEGPWNSYQDDWTLFTLDPLEYREAGIKHIFGSLALAKENLPNDNPLYIVGHGRSAPFYLGPNSLEPVIERQGAKRVSLIYDGNQPCMMADKEESWETDWLPKEMFFAKCQHSGGNSGSPIFSKETNQVIGLLSMDVVTGYDSGNEVQHTGGISIDYIHQILKQYAPQINTTKEILGTGHVRSANAEFGAIGNKQHYYFHSANIRFSPVVEGRTFSHKKDHSTLVSYARDNKGKNVPVTFRLTQTNACGTNRLVGVCHTGYSTTLNVWIDPKDNPSIAKGSSVQGWLPIAVYSNDTLIDNQMLHYQYSNYRPAASPFNETSRLERFTLTNAKNKMRLLDLRNSGWRWGATAVRAGEGPLVDNPNVIKIDDSPYAGATSFFAHVINHNDNKVYTIKLRGYAQNSCTKHDNETNKPANYPLQPINTSACQAPSFTRLWLDLSEEDNTELPVGRYTGMLPLMVRNFDRSDIITWQTPVEVMIDYVIKLYRNPKR